MNKFTFTDTKLVSITKPVKRTPYIDTTQQGLTLLVNPSGSKTFYLYKKIAGKLHQKKIGVYPDTSIDDARNTVKELLLELNHSQFPSNHNGLTFKQLTDKYVNDYAKYNTKTYKKSILSYINLRAQSLSDKLISQISKSDIISVFNVASKSGTYSANRLLEALHAIFNFGIRSDLITSNPVTGIKKHKEKSRDRFLSSEELPRFMKVLHEETNTTVKDYILLSLYTGQRKSNVLSMKWGDINFETNTWKINADEFKNGEAHYVPLTKEAISILQSRRDYHRTWVLPSKTSSSGHLIEPKKSLEKYIKKSRY